MLPNIQQMASAHNIIDQGKGRKPHMASKTPYLRKNTQKPVIIAFLARLLWCQSRCAICFIFVLSELCYFLWKKKKS